MLILQNISYTHPNKNLLFDSINLTLNHNEKIALIGNNGSGKSTLLKLISKELKPLADQIVGNSNCRHNRIPRNIDCCIA
jgi:ATPase subunit of ABC transporter with duplicated ATPase domains